MIIRNTRSAQLDSSGLGKFSRLSDKHYNNGYDRRQISDQPRYVPTYVVCVCVCICVQCPATHTHTHSVLHYFPRLLLNCLSLYNRQLLVFFPAKSGARPGRARTWSAVGAAAAVCSRTYAIYVHSFACTYAGDGTAINRRETLRNTTCPKKKQNDLLLTHMKDWAFIVKNIYALPIHYQVKTFKILAASPGGGGFYSSGRWPIITELS